MKYIVQGNYSKFKVTLTQKSGELIQPYIPTATSEVKISLRGARVYEYKEYEQAVNVLTFSDNGCLMVGMYELEVRIIDSEQHRLRCMYRKQVMVVASNEDIPTDASFETDDVELMGQFDIAASVEITIDDALSLTSTNPVQNKVVTAAINEKYYLVTEDGGVDWYSLYFHRSNGYDEIPFQFADDENAGIISAADKTKLDGIEAGANKTLFDNVPTQDSTKAVTSGGVYSALRDKMANFGDGVFSSTSTGAKVNFEATDGSHYVVTMFEIPLATSSANGAMSASDKTKLDALPTNSDLQTALNTKGDALAGELTAAGYEIDLKSGNTSLSQVYVPFATAQADGLISAADYSKLAGIATGATRVIVDNTFDTTSNNAISNSAVATALGDIDTILSNILGT